MNFHSVGTSYPLQTVKVPKTDTEMETHAIRTKTQLLSTRNVRMTKTNLQRMDEVKSFDS
jgi:hypothetical protein